MQINIQKRGIALHQGRHLQELLILRHGLLRIYDPDTIDLKEELFVNAQIQYTKQDDKSILIKALVPASYHASFQFATPKEANSWLDALGQSAMFETKKLAYRLVQIKKGCEMIKFNYKNSKRSRRKVWITQDSKTICWSKYDKPGKSKCNFVI